MVSKGAYVLALLCTLYVQTQCSSASPPPANANQADVAQMPEETPCPPGSLSNAEVKMVFSPDGTCLTVPDNATAGSPVIVAPCANNSDTQVIWVESNKIAARGITTCNVFMRTVRFRTAEGNLCLDVKLQSARKFAPIELQPCDWSRRSQEWWWQYPGIAKQGRHYFVNADNGVNALSVGSRNRVMQRQIGSVSMVWSLQEL